MSTQPEISDHRNDVEWRARPELGVFQLQQEASSVPITHEDLAESWDRQSFEGRLRASRYSVVEPRSHVMPFQLIEAELARGPMLAGIADGRTGSFERIIVDSYEDTINGHL
jgi:hypothetical protein